MDKPLINDSPFPASPVLPEMLDGDTPIQFRCRKGIACWNACCSNIDITLTPYDILRLSRRLGITTSDFLVKYTFPYEIDPNGIAGVKLKPVDGGSACQFMVAEGCSVYEDRPTSCRYYPVALVSMRRTDENTDRSSYALVKEAHCLGHNEPRTITIADYRKEQGIEEYDDIGRGWRQLILKKKSSGPTIGKPSKRSLQLFFTACYDLDRFREFVKIGPFDETFAIPADEKQKILTSDSELLLFAFRFLRQVLFGENTIALQPDALEKHLEHRRHIQERRAAAAPEEPNTEE